MKTIRVSTAKVKAEVIHLAVKESDCRRKYALMKDVSRYRYTQTSFGERTVVYVSRSLNLKAIPHALVKLYAVKLATEMTFTICSSRRKKAGRAITTKTIQAPCLL